jgi:hypothetical protein
MLSNNLVALEFAMTLHPAVWLEYFQGAIFTARFRRVIV